MFSFTICVSLRRTLKTTRCGIPITQYSLSSSTKSRSTLRDASTTIDCDPTHLPRAVKNEKLWVYRLCIGGCERKKTTGRNPTSVMISHGVLAHTRTQLTHSYMVRPSPYFKFSPDVVMDTAPVMVTAGAISRMRHALMVPSLPNLALMVPALLSL
jgi:hypothetical protein